MKKMRYFIAAGCVWLIALSTAQATDVEVSGLFSGKALVTINGGRPRMLSAGQASPEGVKLLSANSNAAIFEIDGKKQTLNMGQSISTASASGTKPTVKLVASNGGHFLTTGSINGYPIHFMVDTGATTIAFSTAQAQAMGLDLRHAQRGGVATASGFANSYRVMLDNVKVGDISLNMVEAVVIDSMPGDMALLGNSFLSRLEMKREGTVLTLTKNY
ncbi:MAG: retropepsin-like aspartic protease family protein [Burkholderiales bacterium]